MTVGEHTTFGALLRRYRLAATLTQETLAERAGLSSAAVAALERGRRTAPRLDTVSLLAAALELGPAERAALIAAATGGQAPVAPPAPDSAPSVPTSPAPTPLPAAPTALIGREREEAAVTQLLRQDGARVLTLTGPGGVGKTRLALAVATELQGSYADGAVFVDLSALRDHALVAATIAQALNLRELGTRNARDLLLEYLRDKDMLLVLDNVEQVIEAAALVAELVAAAPRLTVLATSRTALRVRAERQFQVPPLAMPATEPPPAPEEAAAYAAVRLFVARAQAVNPDFELGAADAATVAAICRRLDGLPLAIELAAARSALLSPTALLARLERRLGVLTGGARDLPERQQTLRAAIDWSYELLTPEEQTLLRRLAVFAGGCTPEAAEEVCQASDDGDMAPLAEDVLEGLTSLMGNSLLRPVDSVSGEPRAGMLETIREYGLERLAKSGEAEALRRRHAAYYRALAEQAEPALTGPSQQSWLEQLEREHDNLRAALRWARESGETPYGVRLAGTLWRFWYVRGHLTEGREWLDSFLALSAGDGDSIPVAVRAKALTGAGVLANIQGDYERASKLCEDSLALYRGLDDKRGMAVALNILGDVAVKQGDYERAVALSEDSLALQQDLDDKRGIAVAYNNLGVVVLHQGNYGRAATLFEDSLTLNRDLGDKRGIAAALHNLGDVAREQDEYKRATDLYRESLALYQTMDNDEGIVVCLEAIAAMACAQGQPEYAVRLYGAAAALRDAIGAALPPAERAAQDHITIAARAALGDEMFSAAWAAGAALSLEQAIDEAEARAL